MPLITLFTDASWNRRTQLGVWAAWAKFNGKTIRNSGQFAIPMPQSGAAELGAISYGLLRIYEHFDPGGAKIICQTDSQEAITALTLKEHPRLLDRQIVAQIKAFAEEHRWRLDFRHVESHNGTATPRHAVNTWCDTECRRLMGIALGKDTRDNVVEFPQAQLKAEANG